MVWLVGAICFMAGCSLTLILVALCRASKDGQLQALEDVLKEKNAEIDNLQDQLVEALKNK